MLVKILLGVFILTAIVIIGYDFKIQKIPFWLILINYTSLCILINYFLLFGIFILIILKKKKKPIDIVYLFTSGYLILIINNIIGLMSICIILIYIMMSKREKISLMVPIEIVLILNILLTIL